MVRVSNASLVLSKIGCDPFCFLASAGFFALSPSILMTASWGPREMITLAPRGRWQYISLTGKTTIKSVLQVSQLVFSIVTESWIITRSEKCFTSHQRVIWSNVLWHGRVEIKLLHIYCQNGILHHRLDKLANFKGNNWDRFLKVFLDL